MNLAVHQFMPQRTKDEVLTHGFNASTAYGFVRASAARRQTTLSKLA
jgi:hypothetical protein